MVGEASEVFPLQKGGKDKALAIMKRVGTKSFGLVLIQKLEVVAILKGGRKMFPPFTRRGMKGFTLS